VFEFLTTALRKEKVIKDIEIEKEAKLSLFEDDMILSIKGPEDVTKTLLELIKKNLP
jgi:hypothetical protein